MAHEDDDFWNDFTLGQHKSASPLDDYLSSKQLSELMVLTDKGREAAALPEYALEAGTRVAFITNIGSVLSYQDPPAPHTEGTIVMTRTADGDATHQGDMVFVKWDDGRFMASHREHLRRAPSNTKRASSFVKRVSSLGDLTDFLSSSNGDDLIHKATQDLWSMEKDESGELVISRLFSETGEPLKV